AKNDTWSPIRYLQFASQRARPIHDLIAQLKPHVLARNPHPRILDLGCGPGNSTRALLEAFPAAKKITGVDSSPEMLATARRAGIGRGGGFVEGDMAGFSLSNEHGDADRGVDLLFSNAALHWLRTPTLQHNLSTWFAALRPGAVLAFQVPDTVRQPTHVLMRQVACVKDQSWSRYFEDCSVGDVSDASRPDLDPFPQPARLIELFRRNGAGAAADVDIWHTEYSHVLPSASSIVEWVSGTGLRPFLERIADPGAREAFLERYERDITRVY
ncbi:S-adenosyl-L-methionine-dependent methyltransferase, partial [Lojkania enalia]